jgi:hypothetical protein
LYVIFTKELETKFDPKYLFDKMAKWEMIDKVQWNDGKGKVSHTTT